LGYTINRKYNLPQEINEDFKYGLPT